METYHFTCDEKLSVCIVNSIAWAKGVSHTELEPLYKTIKPEVLDGLSECSGPATLSFTYEDYDVEVDSEGNLTLTETPNTVTNVLVLDEECPDHPGEGRTPLYVTFSGPPGIDPMTNATVIHVGRICRGTSSAPSGSPLRVESVGDPTDLDTLGTMIADILAEQESTMLCFDSITELLEHVELEEAFRFFHLLTTEVKSASAVAHYHMDGDDEQTWRTLEPLFGRTIKGV